MVFNLYLSLIELKINALEQASPLQDWSLPKAFTSLQRIKICTPSRKRDTGGKV